MESCAIDFFPFKDTKAVATLSDILSWSVDLFLVTAETKVTRIELFSCDGLPILCALLLDGYSGVAVFHDNLTEVSDYRQHAGCVF